jgi:hypothetical protein
VGYNDSVLVFMSINEMRGRWLNMSYYDSGVDILLSTSQLVELYASLQRVLYNIFCVSGQHRAMFIHFTSKFVELFSRLARITIVANAAQSKKTLTLKNGEERASSSVLESPPPTNRAQSFVPGVLQMLL